jgi:ribosomal protein S12 methylthiotransferase
VRARVHFSPVGCPKANVDLEKAAWRLAASGFEISPSATRADFVIVFACGFIDDAKHEAVADILAYADLKTRGTIKGLVVAGCLPEKYRGELERRLPEVDRFLGNSELGRLGDVLRELAGRGARRHVPRPRARRAADGRIVPPTQPWTRTLMICDGCDNACTYCAIPHMRGRLKSRRVDEVVAEARLLVAQGAREIVLAGQDTASYGTDRGTNELARVLRAVAAGSGAHWIRLAYVNPDNLDPRVAGVMRDEANVCHYVDLPIQHASPRVLAAMGRRRSPRVALGAIENLRRTVPDVALRTTVIVGFPGETEADFTLLLGFLKEVRFDMVGAFRFSPQPGTRAACLPGRVPAAVADERLVEVVGLQEEIARAKARDLVGETIEVLVEEVRGRGAEGRSCYDMAGVDRSVRLGGCTAAPGDFVAARVERCLGGDRLSARCLRGRAAIRPPISLDRVKGRH